MDHEHYGESFSIMVLPWCVVTKLLLEIIILLMRLQVGDFILGVISSAIRTTNPVVQNPHTKKMILCLIKSQIIHDFFFGRQKSINKNQPILLLPSNCSFSKPPTKKKWRLSSPKLRFLSTKKPAVIPPECCHGMSSRRRRAFMGFVMPEAPKPKAKMRPEDNGETKLQEGRRVRSAFAVFPQEGRREARFFVRHVPWRKPKRSEKQQKNAQMLLKFVASLVCWLIFFGGANGRDFTKGGNIHRSYSQGREVFRSVGRLESVFF